MGLYLKGTLAQGIVMIFNALIAGFVAFGFFEMLSKYLINYSPGLALWAPMICFLLLLVLVFAILQAVEMQINKEKIDLGSMPEQIGRPAGGRRPRLRRDRLSARRGGHGPPAEPVSLSAFRRRNPNASSPKKAMLSPDGFVTGLFGTVSKGSFSPMGEPRSFAMLHAGYVDQLHLNRLKAKDVPLMTEAPVLDTPRKAGVWDAPDNLRDTEGKPVSPPAGHEPDARSRGIRKIDEGRREVHVVADASGLRPQGRRRPAPGRQGPGRVSAGLHRRRRSPRDEDPCRESW